MARLDTSTDPIAASLACLQGRLPPGSRVIVFGSRARGGAREDSDLDLLVVEPVVTNRFDEMARLASLLGRNLIPADVVVMSDAKFENERTQPNTLAWRAAQEGLIHDFPC
jgi:predicted nucleotidyltransferase